LSTPAAHRDRAGAMGRRHEHSTSANTGVAVLVWPRHRAMPARAGAVVLQWVLQFTLGLLILSGA